MGKLKEKEIEILEMLNFPKSAPMKAFYEELSAIENPDVLSVLNCREHFIAKDTFAEALKRYEADDTRLKEFCLKRNNEWQELIDKSLTTDSALAVAEVYATIASELWEFMDKHKFIYPEENASGGARFDGRELPEFLEKMKPIGVDDDGR